MNTISDATLCPKHGKATQNKMKSSSCNNKNKPKVGVLEKIFGKSSLELKLEYYSIKLKVTYNHKRKIVPHSGEKPDDKKFLLSELRYFNTSQLKCILRNFQSKIDVLTKELMEEEEEKERHAGDTDGLNLTVCNLEEAMLRTMKPWVNTMPHSDEMTRVMLLN